MEFDIIFQSQKEFFNTHKTKDVAFRKATLLKLKNILKESESNLYEAIYKDFRKGSFDTFLNELSLIYNEIDFFLRNIDRLSKPKKVKTALKLQPGKSYIYNEPLGCTLIIGGVELSLLTYAHSYGQFYCSRKHLYGKTKRTASKYYAAYCRTNKQPIFFKLFICGRGRCSGNNRIVETQV